MQEQTPAERVVERLKLRALPAGKWRCQYPGLLELFFHWGPSCTKWSFFVCQNRLPNLLYLTTSNYLINYLYLYIYLSIICLSIYLSIDRSIHLSIYQSIHLSNSAWCYLIWSWCLSMLMHVESERVIYMACRCMCYINVSNHQLLLEYCIITQWHTFIYKCTVNNKHMYNMCEYLYIYI